MFGFLSKELPIEIFVRHCHYSSVSAHKARPKGFDKKKCFANLRDVIRGDKRVNLTVLLDTSHPMDGRHFVYHQEEWPVVEYQAGGEAASFLWMLDYVLGLSLNKETIVYFLEDDYWHLPQAMKILREGISLPGVDYVTLYDHQDKYFLPEYTGLSSEIFHTASCHFRTTPSTTNTYAMQLKTLTRDEQIHRAFSQGCKITQDHAKFCALAQQGAKLVSSLPGYSSHLEPAYLSPCTNWEKLLELSPH